MKDKPNNFEGLVAILGVASSTIVLGGIVMITVKILTVMFDLIF